MERKRYGILVAAALLWAAAAAPAQSIERGQFAVVEAASTPVMRGGEVLATLPRGQRIQITEVQGDWLGVFVAEVSGWVRRSDVSLEGQQEPAPFPDSPIETIHARGVALLERRDYAGANEAFSEIIRRDPKHPKAYLNRGVCWVMQRRHDRAIEDFTKAIEIDPKNAFIFVNRGMCWRRQDQLDQAIADFTEAIRLNQTLAQAYHQRGLAYQEKGQAEPASADLQRALELDAGTGPPNTR